MYDNFISRLQIATQSEDILGPNSDNSECEQFWDDPPHWIAVGDTPNLALDNLFQRAPKEPCNLAGASTRRHSGEGGFPPLSGTGRRPPGAPSQIGFDRDAVSGHWQVAVLRGPSEGLFGAWSWIAVSGSTREEMGRSRLQFVAERMNGGVGSFNDSTDARVAFLRDPPEWVAIGVTPDEAVANLLAKAGPAPP